MSYRVNGCNIYNTGRCLINTCKVLGKCVCTSCQMIPPSGNTAGRPSAPSTGSLYFDTDEGSLVAYSGSEWTSVGGGGDGIDGAESYYTANCPMAAVVMSHNCNGNLPSNTLVGSLYCGSPTGCGCTRISSNYMVCHRCLVGCGNSRFIPNNCNGTFNTNNTGVSKVDSLRLHESCLCPGIGSVNVLSDGSFYTEETTSGRSPGPGSFAICAYTYCSTVHFDHDTTIHKSDGKVGVLSYPFSFTAGSGLCCYNQVANCITCCRAPTFTHAAFPYGRAACGTGKITVNFSSQFPNCSLIGVTDASNLGKLNFDFDYLFNGFYTNTPGLAGVPHRAIPNMVNAPNNRITYTYSEPTTCRETWCMSPLGLRGFETWVCCCAFPGFNTCYIWKCCWKARPHVFSRVNLADKASYCTTLCEQICSGFQDTPWCTRTHRLCCPQCIFGVARTAFYSGYSFYCGSLFNCSQLSTLYNPCTEKLFVGFKENNAGCTCCCAIACFCNQSPSCVFCSRNLPTMRIYCAVNGCCCGTVSYCGICSSCSYPWALIGACLFAESTSCCFPIFASGTSLHTMSNSCFTKHYFLSSIGNLPCEIRCSFWHCTNPYFIATFCETSCNWGIDNPFSGNCPLSLNNHPYNAFMDVNSCSYGWTCIKAGGLAKLFPTPYCCLCGGEPDLKLSAYINPNTDAAVFAFNINFLQGTCYVPVWAGFACWDLTNHCWASAFSYYNQICDVHNTGNTCPGSIYGGRTNCCKAAGMSTTALPVGFLPYDDGVIFQTRIDPLNNCFGCCYQMCISCSTCTNVPCSSAQVSTLVFKMPFDKPLSCVPGLIQDNDIASYLDWPQALNCGCSSQGKHIYPLFCGITTSAWPRLCNYCTRADNIFFFSGCDMISCFGQVYCGCLCSNANCLLPGCCCCSPNYFRITPCIYTLNTVTDCYHSSFLANSGMTIAPVTSTYNPRRSAYISCFIGDFGRWCYYSCCTDLIQACKNEFADCCV